MFMSFHPLLRQYHFQFMEVVVALILPLLVLVLVIQGDNNNNNSTSAFGFSTQLVVHYQKSSFRSDFHRDNCNSGGYCYYCCWGCNCYSNCGNQNQWKKQNNNRWYGIGSSVVTSRLLCAAQQPAWNENGGDWSKDSVRNEEPLSNPAINNRSDQTELDPSRQQQGGIRLNKVFKETHSRRQADALIEAGRVRVNGVVIDTEHNRGMRVIPYQDIIELDEVRIDGWENTLHAIQFYQSSMEYKDKTQVQLPGFQTAWSTPAKYMKNSSKTLPNQYLTQQKQYTIDEEYIKYWKPVGVTSTTDRNVPGNLLDAMEQYYSNTTTTGTTNTLVGQQHYHHQQQQQKQSTVIRKRIFSVGRLDKDSSGLLLLTSDGRIPNAVLQKQWKQPKVYHVRTNRRVLDRDLVQLQQGIVITTDIVRQGKHRSITAKTQPCSVQRLPSPPSTTKATTTELLSSSSSSSSSLHGIEIILMEGRNRQIRIMLQTLGYRVVELHRTRFMGIGLNNLDGPGAWNRLNATELHILHNAVAQTLN